MNTGVQYLREHIIQEARIHYAITNTGGYSPNVVQPYAEVLYLIRAPKNQQVKEIFERGQRHRKRSRFDDRNKDGTSVCKSLLQSCG